jgi:NADH-ubiquinone oxidoreductase chain 3
MTSITFFLIFIPLLALILLAVNLIFAPHNSYEEKNSAFECGFHSFLGQNRTQFSISFFIFALLFLLFDLEILLVYPYVVSSYSNGIYGLMIMLIFFLALTLGFAFELGKNALKIDSRQMFTLVSKNSSITSHVSMFNATYPFMLDEVSIEDVLILIYTVAVIFIIDIALIAIHQYNPSTVPLIRIDLNTFLPRPYTDDEKKRRILAKITGQWLNNIGLNSRKNIYHEYPEHIRLSLEDVRWLHERLPLLGYSLRFHRIMHVNVLYKGEAVGRSRPQVVSPSQTLIADITAA